MTFGVIGYGRFGKLWTEALSEFGNVLVYDKHVNVKSSNKKIVKASLKQVARTNTLFLLVPISEIENCCREIRSFLLPETLVVDACSVKIFPVNTMKRFLSKRQKIIASHPLFGPDSVRRSGGFNDHTIVICPIRASKIQIAGFYKLIKEMGLKIITSSPKEHDRQMARSQSLVHFIGRGLFGLGLKPQKISTPDFASLVSMNDMVVHDTWQLFSDMQKFNPYARSMRLKFMRNLKKVERNLE